MKVYTLKVFTEPVKMLGDLEVGDRFRIVKGFGEVVNCKVVRKELNDNTVIAYVEQYGYAEDFDSQDLVMVDQVQVRINTIRERE